MEYQNFKGKTVEDALTNASIALGMTSDHISYEVIDKGSVGFLGFASKDAVIRVRLGEDSEEDAKKEDIAHEADSATAANQESFVENREEKDKESSEPDQLKTVSDDPSHAKDQDKKNLSISDDELSKVEDVAENFLNDVFEKMGLTVSIKKDYDQESKSLNLDLVGPDMGVIIGKRGQTLDSLQYLTNLVVNRKTSNYVRVKIDTENYRERRKETLENLAHNVAYKVKKTRRPVALESMNPYERRVIHAALSEDPYVTTHSEGEEPYRHVVVTLK
ncbi:MAG: protein jag [Lachnospiraceae bacterium]|nr:protein jag [Lachnospiraceae bacterium]MDD6578281.1 protein jag [Lachnospiraceae bacterium]